MSNAKVNTVHRRGTVVAPATTDTGNQIINFGDGSGRTIRQRDLGELVNSILNKSGGFKPNVFKYSDSAADPNINPSELKNQKPKILKFIELVNSKCRLTAEISPESPTESVQDLKLPLTQWTLQKVTTPDDTSSKCMTIM
jgi:hypothetical protein